MSSVRKSDNNSNILQLMERYTIETTESGEYHIAFCPFHQDLNRPNFTIYPKTNSYFCFTCSKGGDNIDFFARMEKISRGAAIQRLYDDLQILIDKLSYVPEEIAFNGIIDLHISKQFNEFLSKHPDKLEEVKIIMSGVDKNLSKDIHQGEAVELISKVTKELSELEGKN